MVSALDRVAANGGYISADPPKRKYGFASGQHINLDTGIQNNLWRFGLTTTARNLLDLMATEHDKDGQIRSTQKQLAEHFMCSQPKISKAMNELFSYHFAWKIRRGVVQVNPTYAYRWGSRNHRSLISKLGKQTLKEHAIVIPEAGRPS
ncbi:hypothetical protein [Streptomyces sp. NPDC053367]|uniref:hypothetical protein n=1 Tax=Streptomyces sp. NPDC053367 TaxID=3365700 RepID=UPI0037CF1694